MLHLEGAILHITKWFEECCQNLGFYVGGAKGVMWLHLFKKLVFQDVSESE